MYTDSTLREKEAEMKRKGKGDLGSKDFFDEDKVLENALIKSNQERLNMEHKSNMNLKSAQAMRKIKL